MAGPKKGRDTEARNATVAPLQPKSDIRSFFTKRPQSPAQHETMSPKKPKIEQDTMSMSMLSTSLSLPSISSNNSTRVLASKLVESKSMPSLKPINASQNSLVPVTKLLNHQGAPDDPGKPTFYSFFSFNLTFLQIPQRLSSCFAKVAIINILRSATSTLQAVLEDLSSFIILPPPITQRQWMTRRMTTQPGPSLNNSPRIPILRIRNLLES